MTLHEVVRNILSNYDKNLEEHLREEELVLSRLALKKTHVVKFIVSWMEALIISDPRLKLEESDSSRTITFQSLGSYHRLVRVSWFLRSEIFEVTLNQSKLYKYDGKTEHAINENFLKEMGDVKAAILGMFEKSVVELQEKL